MDNPSNNQLENRSSDPSHIKHYKRKSSIKRGLPKIVQQLRQAVIDSEEEAIDDKDTGGILLNPPNSAFLEKKLSNISIIKDTGSRQSLDSKEDVCFPMEDAKGIDFEEIDDFIAAQRTNIQKVSTFNQVHVISKEDDFSTDESPPFTSNDLYLENLTPIYSRDSQRSRFRSDSYSKNKTVFQDRFTFFTADSEVTLRSSDFPGLLIQDSNKTSYKDLFTSSYGTWWLDCYNPTDAEMKMLAKAFYIHPLTAEDIRTQDPREKVEIFKSYYFVAFSTYEQDWESEDYLDAVPVYCLVFKEGIITFHFSPFQHCANVRRRVRQLRDYVDVTPDWICYAIIDDITDSFAPVIHEIEVEAEIVEEAVFDARDDDFSLMLRRIGKARAKTLTMMRLLSGKADVIRMFAKRCSEGLGEGAPKSHISLYLGDIQDHIVTMYHNLIAYEKILSRSHTNYLAQLQVQSVDANHRVTDTLGKVTVLGTILIPMNLVTGLFGMNVRVPGMNGTNLDWFFGIIGFLLVVVIVGTLLARWWLNIVAKQINGNFCNVSEPSLHSFRHRLTPQSSVPDRQGHVTDYSMV